MWELDKRVRRSVQIVAALVQNAHFKGFFTGKLYTGPAKQVCVPGLNCYSCPGAVGACPIGSMQNALSSYSFKLPYYVMGLLLFFGALLGRVVCGFLCPFGLLEDLLYKIPFFKKVRTFKGDRVLRYLKYVILIVMVIVLPIMIKLTPFFCKYVCPSGTISGILLALADKALFKQMGRIFTWKVIVLATIVIISLMIYRPFCKYLCPLGAIYGVCNKFSLVKLNLDSTKCTECGSCRNSCLMGVDPVKNSNSMECIRCGLCVDKCPSDALKLGIK